MRKVFANRRTCLCEPLNYIDVYSRMQIEQLILQFSPAMLLVEHDAVFEERIATKVITIE